MLLDRVGKLELDPFPHVVIENALEETYYQELLKTLPRLRDITLGRDYQPNQRIDLKTSVAIATLNPVWSEFCKAHVSNEFLAKVWEVFGEAIKAQYPNVKPSDVRMRCQPGINTPTDLATKVRGPHLDNPSELYAGLFYLPTDEDGGDLEIYKWSGPKKFHGKLEVEESSVSLVKTVKYRPNTYLMFLNTPDALHGVTARKSKNTRHLVNVIGDVNWPLFSVGHGRY